MAVADAAKHVFPDVDRVLYRKATIREVVCQVRFPADLRVETEPPADFQQRIRQAFPLLKQKTQSVISGLPPEVAKAFEAVAPPSGSTTIWQFGREDSEARVELMKDRLTLISPEYKNWGDFIEDFRSALDAFLELYKPLFYERIGLRYRNLIRRSMLDLEDVPWHELVKGHVLGELVVPAVGECAVEASRSLVLTLPEKGAQARLQHGFATEQGSDEQCYLIDGDFFVQRTDISDGYNAIEYLHGYAARYFRWCITDRLHEAMQPDPIAG